MKNNIILPNSDWFLPELYDFMIDMGITIIASNINRYVIDLNRNPKNKLGESYKDNLVYTRTTQNNPIYKKNLSKEDIKERTDKYYFPYYKKINKLINGKLNYYSEIIFLDMHSFFLNFTEEDEGDIILSNHKGKSSKDDTIKLLNKYLTKEGFKVSENNISGGFLTKYFGMLNAQNVQSIQMELRYNLYIEDRYFGEEEVVYFNKELFQNTKEKLKKSFFSYFEDIKNKITTNKDTSIKL